MSTDSDPPTIAWSASASPSADPVAEAKAELNDIIKAAGGFPGEVPSATPDPAAQELLARPAAEPLTGMPTSASPSSTAPVTFERALETGAIPTYADQPDDLAMDPAAPPLDPNAERAAWQQLMDYVRQHKDSGTTVTMVDLDTFSKGLT